MSMMCILIKIDVCELTAMIIRCDDFGKTEDMKTKKADTIVPASNN